MPLVNNIDNSVSIIFKAGLCLDNVASIVDVSNSKLIFWEENLNKNGAHATRNDFHYRMRFVQFIIFFLMKSSIFYIIKIGNENSSLIGDNLFFLISQ